MMEPSGMSCFDLKWESVQYSDIAMNIAKGIGRLAIQEGLGLLIPGSAVAGVARSIIMALRAKSIIYDIVFKEVNELFKRAIKNARQSGKQIAIALALSYPFST